jgi:hypothetical protein
MGPTQTGRREAGIEGRFGWAIDEPDDEPGLTSLRPGRALALAAVGGLAAAMAVAPALAPIAPMTLQSLHLEELTSGLAGLAAVVGGVKFLAMAGGVTARFLARPPSAVAIAPGD